MGIFNDFLKEHGNDAFGFDTGVVKRAIHDLYKTGDANYMTTILNSLGTQIFITYFEIPKGLTKKEYKTIKGEPILFVSENNEKFFPIFTKINQLVNWKPEVNENNQIKITYLYVDYLFELLKKEEYSDISGYIINPESNEPLIITKDTLTKKFDTNTSIKI